MIEILVMSGVTNYLHLSTSSYSVWKIVIYPNWYLKCQSLFHPFSTITPESTSYIPHKPTQHSIQERRRWTWTCKIIPHKTHSCMEYGVLACLLHTPPLSLPFLSQTMRWIRPDRMSRARHAPYVVRMYVCMWVIVHTTDGSYVLSRDTTWGYARTPGYLLRSTWICNVEVGILLCTCA